MGKKKLGNQGGNNNQQQSGGQQSSQAPRQHSQTPRQPQPFVQQQQNPRQSQAPQQNPRPSQAPQQNPRPSQAPQQNPRQHNVTQSTSKNVPTEGSIPFQQVPSTDKQVNLPELPHTLDAGGDSNKNQPATRGNLRNRRIIDSDFLLKSRPSTLQSKQGLSGRRVALRANYFRITETYDKGLNQYHVDFTPQLDTKYRKQIIARHKEKFGGYIFDGTKIYTKSSFNDFEFTTKSTISDELVKVNIKFVGAIHLQDAEWLQLYNIIVRRCMDGLKLQLIGRNLFNAMGKIQLKDFNLEIWPGYITSFRQHERDLLLCCDIIHKVMRHETVFHILRKLFDQSQRGRTDFKVLAKNELLGSVILTDYNNKTYRVDDIDFGSNPRSLFETPNGNISYIDYYKNRYNIKINDPQQPLLITKALERNFRRNDQNKTPTIIKLIPELCRATGITDAMKNNRQLMTAMASHTRVNPEQRIQRLQTFQQSLYKTKESSSVLQEFNLKIDSNLVEIPGRVLKEPTLVFGNQRKLELFDWDQCFKNNTLLQGSQLTKWIVLIPGEYSSTDAKNFVKCCQDAGRRMGFQMREPEYVVLQNENNMTYSKILEQVCQRDPQIVMVFVGSNRADLYSCIKKKMTCDRAVPSQVVRMQTVKRQNGLLSVATKVCAQMNAKLRCAPWTVLMPDNVMCIGFDVCHSTRDRTKSYGALVASMDINKKPGTYFSAVSEHMKGNEMSNDIAINVTKALRQYHNEHQKLPSIIFFYRDGVGDGQLHQIYEHEITHVKKAIEKIYNDFKAPFKLSYIVVSKRINTRIFGSDARKQNPEPGTVVDDIITLPQRYDFYLISQSVRQGTVSPTSYNVLFDNTKLPADKIQDMTNRQTHLYFNFFATVRVPAVCQYAHKLAFLVGQYLHQSPNALLEKNLYYL